jgi:glycosyltransferase involved in cell wall biosynthesis
MRTREDEAVKIGRKARMLVEEKYSIEEIVHMIEELYMEAIYKNSL